MKKILAIASVLVLALSLLTACNGDSDTPGGNNNNSGGNNNSPGGNNNNNSGGQSAHGHGTFIRERHASF